MGLDFKTDSVDSVYDSRFKSVENVAFVKLCVLVVFCVGSELGTRRTGNLLVLVRYCNFM